jgi:hypothetical protein
VEDYGRARGFMRLFLSITLFLTGAIRLYERMGFQRSGEGPGRFVRDAAVYEGEGADVQHNCQAKLEGSAGSGDNDVNPPGDRTPAPPQVRVSRLTPTPPGWVVSL